MQHAWLVAACGELGLTRYVLPLPIIARKFPRPAPPRDVRAGWATRVGSAIKAWWDGGEEGKDDEVRPKQS